jgi:Ser/Thr protein kinase RdoA (MazF antagonist)
MADSATATLLQTDLETFCEQRRLIFYTKTDIPVSDNVLRSLQDRKNEEVQHNAQVITDVCIKLFGVRPVSASPLDGLGTFHSLYRVIFPNTLRCIMRVNALSHLYRDFQLYIDKWVMEILKSNDLPSLQVNEVDLSRKLCPFDYEILEEAAGKPLSAFDSNGELDRLLMFELGSTVARLHGIATDGYGLLDVKFILSNPTRKGKGVFDSWREYILLNLERHIRICHDIGALNFNESKKIEAIFCAADPLLRNTAPSLLHGDLGNHNVFSDGKRITAIVDWEDCLSGDPVFDIAFWGTFYPDQRLELFLNGYRAVRQLPQDFELAYWLYYLRIALSKTVHRYRFHYSDHPDRPPASWRIQRSLKRLELLMRNLSGGKGV